MTLCMAWSRNGEISFASDSRLTNAYKQVITDIATKIFTIDVRIISKNGRILLLNVKYGMCFTGSYLNGSILGDTIGELLSSLRMNVEDKIDAHTIASMAFEIYQDVCTHLMQINNKEGLSSMWLAGYCPIQNKHRLFKFSWRYQKYGDGIEFYMEEEPFAEYLIFMGDGDAIEFAKTIKARVDFSKGYTEYHLLKDVIDNLKIPTVGGAIQTGHLLNGQFSTFGMVDYEIVSLSDGTAYYVKPVYTFRGIPLTRAMESISHVSIDTGKVSMAPFTEKQAELEKEARLRNEEEK